MREHVKARERVAAACGVARARVLGHERNSGGAGRSERQKELVGAAGGLKCARET